MPESPKEYVVTVITDGIGHILMGKRNDNGLWTLCAGGLEQGESPEEGAKREILEETGLTINTLTPIKTTIPLPIHFFSGYAPNGSSPHGRNDPDQEVSKWVWIDIRGGIPSNIWNNLHGPEEDKNVLRQLFGEALSLKKSELEWLEAGFLDLSPRYSKD
jgi:8-oxo-dGTP pyrophosphatase MutT (NUDIX family)